MTINKLRALHTYIEQRELDMPERFDSWMEDGKLITANRSLGLDQVVIARLHYDAILVFESYSGNPARLMATITTWLIDHDPEREQDRLSEPEIDVDMIDDRRADVEIKIRFCEDITIVKDEQGDIDFNGEQWRLDQPAFFDVTTVGVGNDEAAPTDLPYTYEAPA